MKIKRLLILQLIIITCICCLLSVGCDKCDSKEENETVIETVSFSEESLNLVLGDEKFVFMSYEMMPNIVLEVASDDDSIATIDLDGKITANGIGETFVRMKYGDGADACKVTVTDGGFTPILEVKNFMQEKLTVSNVQSIHFDSCIIFNGKEFSDHTVTYEYDSTMCQIADNEFKPLKAGKTNVTVKAIWRGVETDFKTFEITIIKDVQLYVNGGRKYFVLQNKELPNSNFYDTEIDFDIVAKENGQDIKYYIETLQGNGVVEYDQEDKKIKVLDEKIGNVKLRIYAVDSEGITHEIFVFISVYQFNENNEHEFDDGWLPNIQMPDDADFNVDWIEIN